MSARRTRPQPAARPWDRQADNREPPHVRADEIVPTRERSLLTPGRLVLALALAGSFAIAVYGAFLDRTPAQVPILASGLAVFGLASVMVALRGGAGALRAGRVGDGAAAFRSALLGGVAALVAAGSLGAAVVLILLWTTVGRVT
jgi:hypothetical protein